MQTDPTTYVHFLTFVTLSVVLDFKVGFQIHGTSKCDPSPIVPP